MHTMIFGMKHALVSQSYFQWMIFQSVTNNSGHRSQLVQNFADNGDQWLPNQPHSATKERCPNTRKRMQLLVALGLGVAWEREN